MFWTKSRQSLGLDISDRALEVVALARDGGWGRLTSLNRVTLAPGLVESGLVKNEVELARVIKQALAGAKPMPIPLGPTVLALPESQFYTLRLNLPSEAEAHLEEAVRGRLATSLPFLPTEIIFKTKILSRDRAGLALLVLAVNRVAVTGWLALGRRAGLTITAFDLEPVALARALFGGAPGRPSAIIDFGARLTSLSLFDARGLVQATDLLRGGESWTTAIAETFHLDRGAAEVKKVAEGLKQSQKMRELLLTELSGLVAKVQTALDRYRQESERVVENVFLTGGGSRLLGLADYLAAELTLPITLGVLPQNLIGHGHHRPLIFDDQYFFIEAAGLALRGLNLGLNQLDPFIAVKV